MDLPFRKFYIFHRKYSKIMKIQLFLLIIVPLLFYTLIGFSQSSPKSDEIFLRNGTSLKGKVLRVTESNIEIDPTGTNPFQMVSRDECLKIVYSDGTSVDFGSNQTLSRPTNMTPISSEFGFYDENGNKLSNFQVAFRTSIPVYAFQKCEVSMMTPEKIVYFKENGQSTKLVILIGLYTWTNRWQKVNLAVVSFGKSQVELTTTQFCFLFFKPKENGDGLQDNQEGGTGNIGNPWLALPEINLTAGENYSQELPPVYFKGYKFLPKLTVTDWTDGPPIQTNKSISTTFRGIFDVTVSSNN